MKQIFYNANIFSKNENKCDSIFVNDDRIVCVGSKDDIFLQKDESTNVHDLKGNLIMPTAYYYTKSLYEKNAKNIKFKSKNATFLEKLNNFQKNCIDCGIATVIYIVQDEDEFNDLKLFADEGKLKIDFLCFIDIAKCKKVMDENCSSFHCYKKHLKIGGYFLQVDGEHESHEAWTKRKYRGTKNMHGYPLVNEKHLEHYLKTAFSDKKQIIVEANGDLSVNLLLSVTETLKNNEKFAESKLIIQNNGLLIDKQIKLMANLNLDLIKIYDEMHKNFLMRLKQRKEHKSILNFNINSYCSLNDISLCGELYCLHERKENKIKFNSITEAPRIIFGEEQKGSFEPGSVATFCIVGDNNEMVINGEKIN